MQIETGLFNSMVIQRDKNDLSDQLITGKGSGDIIVKVSHKGKSLSGFSKYKLGRAVKGKFNIKLKGLPVGGPYKIELKDDKDTLIVKDVLIGDVWILAGQSNMEGIGNLENRLKGRNKVRAFYMTNEWGVAEDPIHIPHQAKAWVHNAGNPSYRPKGAKGVGPGVAFGQAMLKTENIPQGLIACAHCGTEMTAWDPSKINMGDKSFYGAMINRFIENGSKIKGVLWYQGCSDANSKDARVYTMRMKQLIASMRNDFNDKRLPVVVVQIGRRTKVDPDINGWNSIRDQQYRLPHEINRIVTVPVIDLPLDDHIHLSAAGQHILGERLSEAMTSLLHGRKAAMPPIEIQKISLKKHPISPPHTIDIVVHYKNIIGKLESKGRASGFTLAVNNIDYLTVFDIKLDGNKVIINCDCDKAELLMYDLYYGFGMNPYCNITDSDGRSLPAFGPVTLR